MPEYERVPSRVQAREEPCTDPVNCGLPGHADVGTMHEPKPYTGDLDWPEDFLDAEDWDSDPWLHPFID